MLFRSMRASFYFFTLLEEKRRCVSSENFRPVGRNSDQISSGAFSKSASGTSTSSGYIGTAKAKKIALEYAGVSASKADFIKVSLDYDDGVRIYDVEFYAGDYEYEFEINARTGAIYDYDKDYRWDD